LCGWLVALNGQHKGEDFRLRVGYKNVLGTCGGLRRDADRQEDLAQARHILTEARVPDRRPGQLQRHPFVNDEKVQKHDLIDNDIIKWGHRFRVQMSRAARKREEKDIVTRHRGVVAATSGLGALPLMRRPPGPAVGQQVQMEKGTCPRGMRAGPGSNVVGAPSPIQASARTSSRSTRAQLLQASADRLSQGWRNECTHEAPHRAVDSRSPLMVIFRSWTELPLS